MVPPQRNPHACILIFCNRNVFKNEDTKYDIVPGKEKSYAQECMQSIYINFSKQYFIINQTTMKIMSGLLKSIFIIL